MGGESVQLSQAQKRRMEAMSMNMGTRIVCGYLASLLFLGISLYLAVTYHTSGDLQSFWCYLALAAICLTLDVLVTINLLRTIHDLCLPGKPLWTRFLSGHLGRRFSDHFLVPDQPGL